MKNWTLPGSCALWRLLGLQKNVSIELYEFAIKRYLGTFLLGPFHFQSLFLRWENQTLPRFFVVKARAEDSLLKRAVEACQCFTLHHLGSTDQCYTDCTIQQSSTAKNHRLLMPTILSLLPPCPLPGMECTTTTKGMVTSGHLPIPVASKSSMAIEFKTLSKLTRQLKMEKGWNMLKLSWDFVGKGLLFSGAIFPWPLWNSKLCSSGTVKEPPNLRR